MRPRAWAKGAGDVAVYAAIGALMTVTAARVGVLLYRMTEVRYGDGWMRTGWPCPVPAEWPAPAETETRYEFSPAAEAYVWVRPDRQRHGRVPGVRESEGVTCRALRERENSACEHVMDKPEVDQWMGPS
jgi:hypothetical protein